MKVADLFIRYSFYLLFFLVPLWFFAGNYELFEFNKMMLTYGLTVVILCAWLTKLILNFKFEILNWLRSVRRTPLDIPIILYLVSHVLSTVFSIDSHTSVWGYYSRFHEGLLATISYIILFYAAVSNLNRRDVFRIILSSFAAGAIVSFWGMLEHFGHSPSCLFITGKFNVECWVQDVKNRAFASLGQPNWMAAYLDVLILTSLGFIYKAKGGWAKNKSYLIWILIPVVFFTALLFTKSRSAALGLVMGGAVFAAFLFFWRRTISRPQLVGVGLILSLWILSSAIFGLPFSQIEKINLESFIQKGSAKVAETTVKPKVDSSYIDVGISESGDIRKIVWNGAIRIWRRYPVFGSGVETFAYAYYKDRPVEHNLVSEWDFLYNKAHNEFLNILATTGTVGTLAYLSILISFTLWCFKYLTSSKSTPSQNPEMVAALFSAWVSILVTNFFGFSVVIIGIFFFLIPAFSFLLATPEQQSTTDLGTSKPSGHQRPVGTTSGQWMALAVVVTVGLLIEINLINMWSADRAFAYGKNLDGVSQYAMAYPYLKEAVETSPDEPTFRDELSYSEAILAATAFSELKSSSDSAIASLSAQERTKITIPTLGISTAALIQKAAADSNVVVETSPQALTFWKTRTKVFYTLANIDRQFLLTSLQAITKAAELAPTDAKVHYNYGLLLGQVGQVAEAVKVFEETTAMKPDYRDAHYALGLYYNQMGRAADARVQMEFILTRIGPDDEAKKFLEEHPR